MIPVVALIAPTNHTAPLIVNAAAGHGVVDAERWVVAGDGLFERETGDAVVPNHAAVSVHPPSTTPLPLYQSVCTLRFSSLLPLIRHPCYIRIGPGMATCSLCTQGHDERCTTNMLK
jgi:hypothetical protein